LFRVHLNNLLCELLFEAIIDDSKNQICQEVNSQKHVDYKK